MFKLIVVCAFFAVAAAKPGLLYQTPITQYSTYVAPATTILKNGASVIQTPIEYYSPSPLAYTHFIKKRSPQWPILPTTYITPQTYLTAGPLHTPLVQASPILPAVAPIASVASPVHYIKKRSAVLPTTYFASPAYAAATSPILTTSYAAGAPLISSTHLIPSTPLISHPAYTHFIKKRSAPLLSTYISPAQYSESRFDLQQTHSTPFSSIAYNAPIYTPLASRLVY